MTQVPEIRKHVTTLPATHRGSYFYRSMKKGGKLRVGRFSYSALHSKWLVQFLKKDKSGWDTALEVLGWA